MQSWTKEMIYIPCFKPALKKKKRCSLAFELVIWGVEMQRNGQFYIRIQQQTLNICKC